MWKFVAGNLESMSQASALFDSKKTDKKLVACVLVQSLVEREWIGQGAYSAELWFGG